MGVLHGGVHSRNLNNGASDVALADTEEVRVPSGGGHGGDKRRQSEENECGQWPHY